MHITTLSIKLRARAAFVVLLAVASALSSTAQAAGIDYTTTIQPIYNAHCTTCHSGAGADAGLNLQVSSYANTVNKTSGKYGTYRVRPNFATNALSSIYNVVVTQGSGSRHQGNSWVATATQKTNITDWINQGALPNLNPPTVTSLSVVNGGTAGGTSVTITGTAFGGTGAFAPIVTFGGVAATSVVVTTGSFTKITCTTPAHTAGPVDVVVTTTAGGASAALVNGYTYTSGAPAKLAFLQQPATASVNTALAPAMTVQIQDAAGNVTSSTANVTLSIGTNPGGSILAGTTTVAAVDGVATFGGISLDRAGTGYTLSASSAGLTAATSNAFTISGLAPTVTLPTSSSVAVTTATLGGNVLSDGGATISARGVVFAPTSINSSPAIGGTGVTELPALTSGQGVFTVNTASLLPGTSYTFAAYATNSAGTSYSGAASFTTLSNNANLASLATSAGTWSSVFDSAVASYNITVPYVTSSITVTPVCAVPSATVQVNGAAVPSGTASGAINLNVGSNSITVEVTAQDNSTKTYTLSVSRTAISTNANLAALAPSSGTLTPGFNSAVTEYTVTVPYAISTFHVTPVTADSLATVQVNGSGVISGNASSSVPLNEGSNTITTIVAAENGSLKTYTVTVIRGANSTSATLANLVPSSGTLTPAFHFGTTSYTLNVTLETTSITLTPTLSTASASVKVNNATVADMTASGPVSLNIGSNIVNTVVTSQDATQSTTYVVTVNRLPSSNANLAGLLPDTGSLAPAFDSAITSYTLDVQAATGAVSLIPVASNEHATLQINGATIPSGGTSAPQSLVEGENSIAVAVTAQDNTIKTYTVTVRRPFQGAPRIVSQPASQTVAPLSNVSFTVAAVGTDPLTYKWRKGGIIIANATASTYTLTAVQAAAAGAYSVVVTNSAGSTISDIATLTVAKAGVAGMPEITAQPASVLAAVGQTATFSSAATGAPTLGYQWRKLAAAIPLATGTSYTTPPTTLASAGIYSMLVKNSQGTVISAGARLGVVSAVNTTRLAKAGTPVTLTVLAAGEGLIYRWKKDGVELNDSINGTHIVSGTRAASLVIKGSTTSDTGLYTCLVRMGALSRESGATTLNVYDKAPIIQLASNSALPPAIVSGTYHDGTGHAYQIPVDPGTDRAVVTFTAAKLPAGLVLNPTTGVISGKPTVASPAGKPFVITLTAANAVNKHSVPVLLTVSPLPSAVVGTFNGLVDRDASLTQGLSLNVSKTLSFGGSFNLTSLPTGGFSGKLTLGTVTHSFLTKFLDAEIGASPTAVVTIPRPPSSSSLVLSFVINKDTGELTGTLTDGAAPAVNVHAWHHTAPAAAMVGSYTAMLDFTPGQVQDPAGDLAYPQGYGFGTLTVTATGATWSGKLADGTVTTVATTVGSTGQVPLHLMLYAGTGFIHGWVGIAADSTLAPTNAGLPLLDGSIDWAKARQADTSTNHNYKSGFPLHRQTIVGGKYVKPATTVLGLVDGGLGTTNARLTFSDGGLEGPSPIVGASMAAALNATTFRITGTNTLVMPTGAIANPATLALTLNASTGALGGSCLLKNDPDPTDHILPTALLTRKLSFAGVLIPRVGINKGVGCFLLSKLPQDLPSKTTLLTSDILSGQFILGPK